MFSVHQTDTIYYGHDLEDYLEREFGDTRSPLTAQPAYVQFWSEPNQVSTVGPIQVDRLSVLLLEYLALALDNRGTTQPSRRFKSSTPLAIDVGAGAKDKCAPGSVDELLGCAVAVDLVEGDAILRQAHEAEARLGRF